MNTTIVSRNGYLAPRRVDLFSEVSKELDHAMNNIFGHDFFTGISKKGKGYPLMDAVRTSDELVLQYTVPGVNIDDLNVEITEDAEGSLLTVSGFLHEDYLHKDEYYQIKELSSQDFRRVIRLPKDIVAKDPDTKLKDGILTIKFKCIKSSNATNNKITKVNIKQG